MLLLLSNSKSINKLFITDNLVLEKGMERVYCFIKMEDYMREDGSATLNTVRAMRSFPITVFIKGSM